MNKGDKTGYHVPLSMAVVPLLKDGAAEDFAKSLKDAKLKPYTDAQRENTDRMIGTVFYEKKDAEKITECDDSKGKRDQMAFGENLKKILSEKKLSIKELSEATGISLHTLYSITKRDSCVPRRETIDRIAQALGVPVSSLFFDTGSIPCQKEVMEDKVVLDFEESQKDSIVQVVLLCKGWYDNKKYPSVLEALKQYYRQYYCCPDYEEIMQCEPERFLIKTILTNVMQGISKYYPDRIMGFLNHYLLSDRAMVSLSDEVSSNYDQGLFYRIVSFLNGLQMHGAGWIDIDSSKYIFFDCEKKKNVLLENIID